MHLMTFKEYLPLVCCASDLVCVNATMSAHAGEQRSCCSDCCGKLHIGCVVVDDPVSDYYIKIEDVQACREYRLKVKQGALDIYSSHPSYPSSAPA